MGCDPLREAPVVRACRKCGQAKRLEEFTRNAECRFGRGHVCKECSKGRDHEHRELRRDATRARHAAWRAAHPEQAAEHQARYRRKHAVKLAEKGRLRRVVERERIAARCAMNHAVRDGHLVRGACERCGATEHVEGHHVDYRRPLDVTWLCAKCHKTVHRPQETEVAA
jgi:hypothetical protein